MDFSLSDEQLAIREAVGRICAAFDDDYWLERDRSGSFPDAFRTALIEGGWLGIAMPEEFGGSGLGITEAAIMMHAIARSAGAMSAASTVHINLFGPHPIVVFGTPEQKQRWLPDVIAGHTSVCFGVTEPDAGLDTGSIRTMAEKSGNGYVISGQKIWTSTAGRADKILLLARTSPHDESAAHTGGLSLFYTDLDRDYIEVREIEKMGRAAVDSNEVFIDGLPVPLDDRIGEEGKGFQYLLHGLNPERVLVGAEAVGIGQRAIELASRYARDRVVFGRPIGQNQAIQHPLADSWMALEAADGSAAPTRFCCWPAPLPMTKPPPIRGACRSFIRISIATTSRYGKSKRWAVRRWIPTKSSSTAFQFPSTIVSARRAKASSICSTGSIHRRPRRQDSVAGPHLSP